MRWCILATLASLALVIPSTAVAADPVIPQDLDLQAKRSREALAWHQRTLVGAYDKVGKKDPRWDKPAREALEAAARFFSGHAEPAIKVEEMYVPAKQAIDAGCDDPLILFLYANSSYNPNYPGQEEMERRYATAAAALEVSSYAPVRRMSALFKAGKEKLNRKELPPEVKKEAERLLDAALAQVVKSVKEDERNPIVELFWYDMAVECMRAHRKLNGDRQKAFEHVDALLAKQPDLKVTRLNLKANFLVNWAWEARGGGFANTVTPEGGQKFNERLTEAKKALEEAWAAGPGDLHTANMMLMVDKGIGGERDEMEKWFERAMKANPANRQACELKMDWLDPKWHGNEEDMMAFGRACRDTKNWKAGITLLIVDAHRRMMYQQPQEERMKYFRKPEVWKEVRDVYDEYFLHFPNDSIERSRYAGYCYLGAKWAEAQKQYDEVGPNLAYFTYFPERWVKQVKEDLAKKVKGP